MLRGLRLASFLGAMLATAASLHAAELFPIYQKLQKAIAADDWPAAKALLSNLKIEQFAEKTDDEKLSALDVISPKERLRAHKEIIDGDDATLIVLANVADNPSVGRVEFVREAGQWKLLSELWDIGGKVDDAPAGVRQPQNDVQRNAIRRLRARGFATPTADFLVMAAVDGDLEAVQLFVEAGYPVDQKSDDGSPAIVSAAMFGKTDVVDWLIDHGADVNASDGATTALHRLADKCEASPTIAKLLAKGAKRDVKTAGGATALQMAEWANCDETVQLLRK
ncbi:MAG TPA: ankyrin repeat domain-containing protein [Thermoanaerobaculia bacterium]|nr:ankyrin repeat domain-containing protein [Thermoanaerobaculia bacterium]